MLLGGRWKAGLLTATRQCSMQTKRFNFVFMYLLQDFRFTCT